MKKILFIILPFFVWAQAFSQVELLQSGPMVGYTTSGVSKIWVQTKKEAVVKIKYYERGFSGSGFFFTKEYATTKSEGYVALLLADKTLPRKTYFYELYINAVAVPRPYPLRFKTSALDTDESDTLKIAMGSCVYINDTTVDKKENLKGGGYEIYTTIAAQQPDMMLWLGDNVYFRKSDWQSKEGMMYRYTHTRSLLQMQPLLGATENIALWDDHDYGPNDSDKGFKNKKSSQEVFNLFWANPSSGFSVGKSIATTFVKGDVQFFLLDDRTFRSPKETDSDDKKELLGEEQLNWLLKELKSSKATFKLVAMGGQVLNPLKVFETYANYKEEWKKLLSQLEQSKISGVVFFSGDRHFSEVMKMERGNNYPLYEFTVSPLNSTPYTGSKEQNEMRISGSLIAQRNFATLEVFGIGKDRTMRMQYRSIEGVLLYEKVIRAEELR